MATPQLVTTAKHQRKYRLYRDDELHLLPKPEWGVEDLLPHQSLAVVFGFRGDGKTFFLLALLFSLCTGRSFFGRRVRRGWCVYVGPEGAHSLHRRILALKHAERHPGALGLVILPQAIQLLSLPGSVMPLADDIEALEGFNGPPAAICIDTLSRNSPGAKENAQEDMSLIVAACDYLRHRFGCTVLLAHHTRKGDDELRGSSVLDGSADTCVLLKKEGSSVTVSCTKQKDAAPFEPFTLELTPIADSCVLRSMDTNDLSQSLTKLQMNVLQCLADISLSDGCSTTVWQQSCTEDNKAKVRTFYNARKVLLARGYVTSLRGKKLYAVSPEGHALLQLQTRCNGTANAAGHPTAATAGGDLVPLRCSADYEMGDAWEPNGAAMENGA